MSNYWSQYWQQGHLTSFGEDFKNNYEGLLKDVWNDFFKQVNCADSVLDIGTGNGALIALALENNNVDCKYVGIDYAQLNIRDSKLLNNDKVSFVSNVAAENLPFENKSFSKVISQFALEYTEINIAIDEIVRVLKPGGTFQFVCHHEHSTIVLPNNAILDISLKIMQQGGPLDTATRLVKLLSIGSQSNFSTTETIRNELNLQLADIAKYDEVALYATNFPKLIQNIFSKRSVNKKNQIIAQFTAELDGLILRLTDLKNAALTTEGISSLIHHCKKSGLLIEGSRVLKQEDSSILGYQVSGTRC